MTKNHIYKQAPPTLTCDHPRQPNNAANPFKECIQVKRAGCDMRNLWRWWFHQGHMATGKNNRQVSSSNVAKRVLDCIETRQVRTRTLV